MRIVSTFLPAEPHPGMAGRPAIVMALDTLVDQKAVVVGVTIGQLDGPTLNDIRLSDVGRTIVDRCSRHLELNYPQGAVVIAGVAQVAGVKQRVGQVLTNAPQGAFVLLVAATDDVCAAVIKQLNIKHQPPGVGAQ